MIKISEYGYTPAKKDDDTKEFKDFNKELRKHGFEMWRTPYKMSCTVEEMQTYINEYFDLCDKYGQLPSVKGLCLYIGISTIMFNNAINNPESGYRNVFISAKDYIHSVLENRALNSKISSSVYMFTAQNFYDMSTTQKIDVNTNTKVSLNVENSQETIEALKMELLKQKTNKVQFVPEDAIVVRTENDGK